VGNDGVNRWDILGMVGSITMPGSTQGWYTPNVAPTTEKECRNTEGFFKCLGDVGLNFGLGFIPGVGIYQAITGTEVTAFQDVDIVMTGPSAAGLSSAGSRYAIYEFDALGGQTRLDKYNEINKRNGLGTRPTAVRRSLSNLRTVGKSFGTLGNILGIFDMSCEINDCYKKYCKK
jgi:hypothetical protein